VSTETFGWFICEIYLWWRQGDGQCKILKIISKIKQKTTCKKLELFTGGFLFK